MPGKGKMPATNCNPGNASWSGTEDGKGEDLNTPLAAYTAAMQSAEKKADAEMKKFEAQGCPAGCPNQTSVRDDATITVTQPITKQPVKGKGMAWVCELTYAWSETIYCYNTPAAKQAADDDRKKAKLAKEEKAKKDGH